MMSNDCKNNTEIIRESKLWQYNAKIHFSF
jgi:hypothetical protein